MKNIYPFDDEQIEDPDPLWKARAKQLSSEHWLYHEKLIPVLVEWQPGHKDLEVLEQWYRVIFEHGYKHALEDMKEGYYGSDRKAYKPTRD